MKLRLSAIAIVFSLAYAVFPALAADSINVTQSGGNNTIDASQSGNAPSGAHAIAIQQDGNFNEITVSQRNIQGAGSASVSQTNDRNIAKIEQIDSTDVKATITQSMDGNNAAISQINVRNATAEITQSHGGGMAGILQNNGSTDVSAVLINSHPNSSNITQSNVNVGKAIIEDESGAGNGGSILQHDGNNLYASISIPSVNVRQSFTDITQTGSFQNASIELTNGTSDSHASIHQDGTQNDAGILQSGLIAGSANIVQTGLGGLNVARISQTGGGHSATITQNGSNFTANLNQSGSSNTATISQHF